jgi:hypothetical protein
MRVLGFVVAYLAAASALWRVGDSAGKHVTDAAGGIDSYRVPLEVEVDSRGRMYVGGQRTDTLLVHRRQVVYWKKRDGNGPDLTILFERRLFRVRHRLRIVLTGVGRPRGTIVSIHARMKVYTGTPENGFVARVPEISPLFVRVLPPPSK